MASHLWAPWEHKGTSCLGNTASQQGGRPGQVTLKPAWSGPLWTSTPFLHGMCVTCWSQDAFVINCTCSCQTTRVSTPDTPLELPLNDTQRGIILQIQITFSTLITLRSLTTLLSLAKCLRPLLSHSFKDTNNNKMIRAFSVCQSWDLKSESLNPGSSPLTTKLEYGEHAALSTQEWILGVKKPDLPKDLVQACWWVNSRLRVRSYFSPHLLFSQFIGEDWNIRQRKVTWPRSHSS